MRVSKLPQNASLLQNRWLSICLLWKTRRTQDQWFAEWKWLYFGSRLLYFTLFVVFLPLSIIKLVILRKYKRLWTALSLFVYLFLFICGCTGTQVCGYVTVGREFPVDQIVIAQFACLFFLCCMVGKVNSKRFYFWLVSLREMDIVSYYSRDRWNNLFICDI